MNVGLREYDLWDTATQTPANELTHELTKTCTEESGSSCVTRLKLDSKLLVSSKFYDSHAFLYITKFGASNLNVKKKTIENTEFFFFFSMSALSSIAQLVMGVREGQSSSMTYQQPRDKFFLSSCHSTKTSGCWASIIFLEKFTFL